LLTVQTLAYNVFDPSPCAFPPPRVPLLPTLARASFGHVPRSAFVQVGAQRARRAYTRGRYALHDAYRLSGVGPQGALLAPAYHCRTMLDPAISLDGPILLYALDEQLAPDLHRLREQVRSAAQPVRALLLTHYFGFAQAIEAIKALCDAHDIVLIEDCSHTLFTREGVPGPGAFGRYVTASPYKMFPCEDGGLLMAEAGAPLPEVRAPGLRAELKAMANAVEHAWAHRRASRHATDIGRLDGDIAQIIDAPLEPGTQARADQAGPSRHYDRAEEGLAGSRVSRWLTGLCNIEQLAERRRANYRRWHEAVRGLPNCRALFERLPDDCVPYMFPLRIDHPQPHFFMLKKLGVPIWRWDDMAASDCAISQRYREHLLHLPCHQALSDAELQWMLQAVSKVMRCGPVPAAIAAA
jgi:dTDP-4-amino-4,6-dideoxygalactose transaminase